MPLTTLYRGEQGSVKFDDAGSSANPVVGTRSWSLTLDKAVLETTAIGDSYAGNVGSIISGSGSVEVIYTATASETGAFVDHINTAQDQGTALFELYLFSTTKKIVFDGVVTSADFSATVGELQVVTINFVTNGTITTTL
jgi:hypothetical protein